jgi:hypothetical protein
MAEKRAGSWKLEAGSWKLLMMPSNPAGQGFSSSLQLKAYSSIA